jgi:hypothetical protein
MPSRSIKSIAQLRNLFTFISTQKLPMRISWVLGDDRSTKQNNLMWLWVADIEKYLGDTDAATIQATMKLEIGVPIMRAASESFRQKYDEIIKPMTYEQKIICMRDFGFSVTSEMTIKQMNQFLDHVWQKYTALGIELSNPDPEMVDYLKSQKVAA